MIPENLQNTIDDLRSKNWIQSLLRKADDVWVVGGIVRDAFLGKESKDVDLVVEGLSIEQILNILNTFGKASLEGESFSVIKFMPKGFKGEPFDIAIPRMDRKIGSGHKGFEVVTDGVDIEGDLRRRDFTINSMAINVETGELLDPFDGWGDLMNNILRATDKQAFIEDPLRILRGIQFAARFGFSFSRDTLDLIKQNAQLIKEISGERIFGEFIKIIKKEGDTNYALKLLNKTGLDKALFDKEMLVYEEGLDNLDAASFFYVLGLLGDVDAAMFLKKRLKADNELVEEVRAVTLLTDMVTKNASEENLKFAIFKVAGRNPKALDAVVLPPEVDEIVLDMRTNKIPMTKDDILITGDDIMAMSGLKAGPEVGLLKDKVILDALMNRFNWKDRDDSIEYLSNLLS